MKRVLVVLTMMFCIVAFVFGTTYRLPVFETSDVHGYIVDTSSSDEATYSYRLAYIADKVNDKRAGRADSVLLVDGGDIYQGNALSNLQNGAPLIAAYEAMGYDAVAIGNHEFDWGIDMTVDADATMPSYSVGPYSGDSTIPVLCSNLYKNGVPVSFARPYVIVEKTAYTADGRSSLDVKVGIIGYSYDFSGSILDTRFSDQGFTITESIARLKSLVAEVKGLGADAIVIVTHDEPSYLAKELGNYSDVDLICGGHTHTNNVGTISGNTYIEPAGQACGYAYAELSFETNSLGKISDVTAVNARYYSLVGNYARYTYDTVSNQDDLDPSVLAISKAALAASEEAVGTVIGHVTVDITKSAIGSNARSSVAGNWVASLAARSCGAEVAVVNNGGIRTTFRLDGAKERDIKVSDILELLPFGNHIYKYEITFADLLDLMTYCVNRGANFQLRVWGDIKCYYIGKSVNGIEYDGTPVYKNSQWIGDWKTRTITLATNEYVATADNTPFGKWSAKLVSSDVVDNEGAIQVLKDEAASNGGLLTVDTTAHLIVGTL